MEKITKTFVSVHEGVEFALHKLEDMKVHKKEAMQAAMATEAAIIQLLEHAPSDNKQYTIVINKHLFKVDVQIYAEGEAFELVDNDVLELDEVYKNEDKTADFVLGLVKRAFRNNIHIEHRKNTNVVYIKVEESDRKELIFTLGSLVLGCLVGLLFHLSFSEEICERIDYYTFDLVKTIFLNALQIIVGPVVFFSLASCISRYTNLADLGRLGIKTMAMYLFTTVIAIGIGMALFTAFPTGSPNMMQYMNVENTSEDEEITEVIEEASDVDFSIRGMISDIVPNNLFKPFVEMKLLQIIFIAIVMGIGVGKCGEYAPMLKKGIEAFNKLFMGITEIITSFIAIAIFCSMAELVMLTGLDALLTLLVYAALVVGGMLCMIIFYSLFMLVTTGLNPLTFFKKFSKAMMTAFAVSSGTATMPTSMECCRKMGIDNKIVSFTIPLGANVNMDGSCMVFIITVMFMCRIFGIDLSGGLLLSTVISIIFLSLGSPTMAGADLVILAVLLVQLGIPIGAIGFIMGIDAIFDMVQAVSNTTGDAVVSLVVAKSEGLLDKEVYNS